MVGFNWNNGSLIQVTVQFEGIPAGRTSEQIAALSRTSIKVHFRQAREHIIISFSLPGDGRRRGVSALSGKPCQSVVRPGVL
ncbi:MAG: hypothetical protein ABI767_03465 [Rhodanobacter sp.]